MKTLRLYTYVLAILLFSQSSFATNGDNLIGLSAVSRAMGGTGIGHNVGPESALKNPALLKAKRSMDMSFAATYFAPSVSAHNKGAALIGQSPQEVDSDANSFAIPAIGLVRKVNDKMHFGLGAYGTAGLGVDYRNAKTNGLFGLSSALSLFKFSPAISYNFGDFNIGLGLPFLYGTLSMGYLNTSGEYVSPGLSDDLGMGYDIGFSYNMGNFIFGFNYASPIKLEYALQLTEAAADFGLSSEITSNELEQPAEMGLGLSYNTSNMTLALDYKMVQWGEALGYKDFGWENQSVIALGASYSATEKTKLRLGYNMGSNPLGSEAIENSTMTANGGGKNFFNLVGFPAIVESHITFGVGYSYGERFTLNFSGTFSPEVTKTAKYNAGGGDMDLEVKHSQMSFTLAGNWSF